MLNQCLFPSIVIFLFNSTFCFITFLAHRTYTSDFFFKYNITKVFKTVYYDKNHTKMLNDTIQKYRI